MPAHFQGTRINDLGQLPNIRPGVSPDLQRRQLDLIQQMNRDAAARSGATTAFLAALGDDAAGALLRQVLEGDGIDNSGVRVVDGLPTGRALITVADDGENSIVVVPA